LHLTGLGEDPPSRRGDRPTCLVAGGFHKGDHAADRQAHLDGESCGRENLDATAVRLHEAVARACSRTRHFRGLAALLELVDCVGGGFHIGELVENLLAKVVAATDEAELRLATDQRVVS